MWAPPSTGQLSQQFVVLVLGAGRLGCGIIEEVILCLLIAAVLDGSAMLHV